MTGRLAGKVAIITGAARGQGAVEARMFVDEGAKVVVADVLDAEGEAVAKELGDDAVFVHLDVSQPDQWKAAVGAAEETFGKLDVLVNNAGILHFSTIEKMAVEDYMRVVSVNQVGTFLGMQSVIEPMRKAGGGSIVNISSIEGILAMGGTVAYASTKFAIRGMTKVAALELGRDGIRVNSVHPGTIRTPMTDPLGDITPIGKIIPLRRVGESEDVAAVVLFLASDDAAYCSGAEFVVDGGVLAGSMFAGSVKL
ncbi:MAG: glucose 1-dehydrogenase [Actinobacteria bacterium]|nr:glucose 1-dehydrogenase [Actinomycetota bacterium]MBV9663908.1 glucose 1-dehydrogenase [Actinomycetota bacterium]